MLPPVCLLCVCVCVCVCERERERVCVCVCVCVRERESVCVCAYACMSVCECRCNVCSMGRDQMSSSDSVATTTENPSRLGYKHVCINYLHKCMASHDCQKVIQHTHTHPHTHTLTESFYFSPLNSHLSFNTNSSGEWKFQIWLNQKHKSQACHKQTKEGVRRHKGLKSQYS